MQGREKIAPLFAGWDDKVVLSYLQGHMGSAMADDAEHPRAAQIWLGDFCYFAGEPDEALAARAQTPIIVPRGEAWAQAVERAWGGGVRRDVRYGVKTEPDVFDTQKLWGFTRTLPSGYTLRLFDEELYDMAMREGWSRDFCAQFKDRADFCGRGLGVGILYGGALVAGASSYCIYDGGVEIEICTRALSALGRREPALGRCGGKAGLSQRRRVYGAHQNGL